MQTAIRQPMIYHSLLVMYFTTPSSVPILEAPALFQFENLQLFCLFCASGDYVETAAFLTLSNDILV